MNETLKAISERYSCRDFADTPLTDEQVQAIATAALASPSAMNRMAWHISIITNKDFVDELDIEGVKTLEASDKATYDYVQSRGGKLFYNAPCMVVVSADESSYSLMDCGIVSENIALAAHALGLGNVICGMAGIPLNGSRSEEFSTRLQFPDGYKFAIAVLIGTANSGKEPHALETNKVSYVR